MVKSDGLLFYNIDGKYIRDFDFIVIQVIGGKIQMLFNFGYVRSVVVVEYDKFVNDGQWYIVIVIRNRKVSVCVCFV